MLSKRRIGAFTAFASLLSLASISAAYAFYDSPYYVQANYTVTSTGLQGTCTNPGFTTAPSDGVGQYFGLTTTSPNDETAIGISIGRYIPSVNSYAGYFVDHYSISAGTETFYPFTNRTVQPSTTYVIVKETNSSLGDTSIAGQTAVNGLSQTDFSYSSEQAGLHQEEDNGGNPLEFANFTSGMNCSNLQAQVPRARFGPVFQAWPGSTGSGVSIMQVDPPNEKSATGTYSNAQFTITH